MFCLKKKNLPNHCYSSTVIYVLENKGIMGQYCYGSTVISTAVVCVSEGV